MVNLILLYRGRDVWLEKFVGPHARRARKFYGSDTVRTEYGSIVPASVALRRVARRRKGIKVLLQNGTNVPLHSEALFG
jgi:hypothetical protein